MKYLKYFPLFAIITITLYGQDIHYKGKIIDMHSHISFFDEGSYEKLNPSKIVEIYGNKQIERVGAIVIANKGQNDRTRNQNDSLILFCKNNTKFFPICSVHPDDNQFALDEIKRIYEAGVRFIKLHSSRQGFNIESESVRQVVKTISDLGMIILFDGWDPADADLIGKIVYLAQANPNGKFIIAHLGGPQFNQMLILNVFAMFGLKNVLVDISAVLGFYEDSPYVEQIKWTIRKIGIDKVLFGSDYPISTAENSVKTFMKYGFTKSETESILYKNAKELLDSKSIK